MVKKQKPKAKPAGDPNASAIEAGIRARLRGLRQARGWTAETAAEALVVGVEAYRKWEKVVGGRNPPLWLLPRIALVYNVTLDWLLTGRQSRVAVANGGPLAT
ncbi:MAG: helix-turn-helix transcriptional regulator [Phycisphaerae bacterium]